MSGFITVSNIYPGCSGVIKIREFAHFVQIDINYISLLKALGTLSELQDASPCNH